MKTGIIGGSGIYDIDGLKNVKRKTIRTPFGPPSDQYVCGKLGTRELVFLPRHGRGHRLLPSEINHRANIYGFKLLEVARIVSISAVGSLRDDLRPRDIILPDQYFDRTKQSASHTFFGGGCVAHVSLAQPTCPDLRDLLSAVARDVVSASGGSASVTNGGTYVNMEGPAFSTRAESLFHRRMGFDVVGMTSLAEAKLCREAEICYAPLAMVTDYDCWRDTGEPVNVEMLIGHLTANAQTARKIIRELAARITEPRRCQCRDALRCALLTKPDAIPKATRRKLMPILGRYLK